MPGHSQGTSRLDSASQDVQHKPFSFTLNGATDDRELRRGNRLLGGLGLLVVVAIVGFSVYFALQYLL